MITGNTVTGNTGAAMGGISTGVSVEQVSDHEDEYEVPRIPSLALNSELNDRMKRGKMKDDTANMVTTTYFPLSSLPYPAPSPPTTEIWLFFFLCAIFIL